MLIVHFPESDKTIELSGRDVAVHMDGGESIQEFELHHLEDESVTARFHTVLGKVYEVESINQANLKKLIRLWQQHKENPVAIYLDGDKAKLTNHGERTQVFCCVREV
ncbi:MAG: hypothetical protein OXU23_03670 [Candidatus Poribacteria bacterium]|nr:hypothetical protein [Candidatus Poribacteria bacterium]